MLMKAYETTIYCTCEPNSKFHWFSEDGLLQNELDLPTYPVWCLNCKNNWLMPKHPKDNRKNFTGYVKECFKHPVPGSGILFGKKD